MEDSVTGADPSVGGSAGEDSGAGNFAVGVSVLPLEAALSEMESEDRGMLDGCLSSVLPAARFYVHLKTFLVPISGE